MKKSEPPNLAGLPQYMLAVVAIVIGAGAFLFFQSREEGGVSGIHIGSVAFAVVVGGIIIGFTLRNINQP